MSYKIYIVIDNLGEGGAQRQVIEYLKAADRKTFSFLVVNLTGSYSLLKGEIEKLGIEVIGISHAGFLNLVTLIKLVRLFKKERPDVVYTYLFTSDTYGRLAAKFAGIKVIICATRAVDQWKKWHHIFVDRILANFTDKITINAQNIKPYLVDIEKLDPSKIVTIYNGIDLKRFDHQPSIIDYRRSLGLQPNGLVVGMVGHFSERKDYKTFFEAAKIVAGQIPNVYFVAVGEDRKSVV
jgi:glycosyltransferase involved in cell wall biosynthesis